MKQTEKHKGKKGTVHHDCYCDACLDYKYRKHVEQVKRLLHHTKPIDSK